MTKQNSDHSNRPLSSSPSVPPASQSRMKRSVFRNLLLSMVAFGMLIGCVFPPLARFVLGSERALSLQFFGMCIAAGFLVGLFNYLIFDLLVSRELARVVSGMHLVLEKVAHAEGLGEECENQCRLKVNSQDAIGEIEKSFNNMTSAIALRLKKESTLRQMSSHLAASVELNEIVEIILSSFARICAAKAGLLFGDRNGEFALLSNFGIDDSDLLSEHLNQKLGPIRHALETDQILTYSTEKGGMDWVKISTPLGTFQPQLMLVIPLLIKQQPIGILVLACDQSQLPPADLDLMEFLRGQAAPYLQNAILHRKITDLAAIDDLTRVLNRRFGLLRLKEEFSRSTRHGVSLSVMMVDIDHFKGINDAFGHTAGDRILCSVAAALESGLRAGDVLCRFGGDEFLIIVPGTGILDSARLAERIRLQVEQNQVEWEAQPLSVTITIGIATWPMDLISNPEEMVSFADRALYGAKDKGRNRVAAWVNNRSMTLSELETT
jgi:two-component system, cell cycle response regulator